MGTKKTNSTKMGKKIETKPDHVPFNLEELFKNSKYFKKQKIYPSTMKFCSGDFGEHQWTIKSCDTIESDDHRDVENIKTPHLTIPERKEWDDLQVNSLSYCEKDREVVRTYMERLYWTECELQITKEHLKECLKSLQKKEFESTQMRSRGDSSENTSETEKLKKQVKEMESFLQDYDLLWVGDSNKDIGLADFDRIQRNFKQLNLIASHPKIIQTIQGAKFELPRELQITLYSNGLTIDGEFKPYKSSATIHFLKDIEDGFFPSELQGKYPDGVPFQVTDKRDEEYQSFGRVSAFQGSGTRLGSSIDNLARKMIPLEPVKADSCIGFDKNDRVYKQKVKKTKKEPSPNLNEMHLKNCFKYSCSSNTVEKETCYDTLTLKTKLDNDVILLRIRPSVPMYALQEALCQLLAERNLLEGQMKPHFKINIFGMDPILLDNVEFKNLQECGIVENCFMNVTYFWK